MAKILIVDDETLITNSLVGNLKMLGYDISGAKNSNEAFKALENYKPDILLLDINLREKITGFDILKKALELNPKIKVAILAGGDYPMQECLKHGVKTMIKKPVAFEKLVDIINEFIKATDS